MKRKIAWAAAVLSALYVLVVGPMFDPLPLIDEGLALMVFVRSMAYLGYDVTRWLPFLGKMRGKVPPDRAPGQAKNMTVDV